MVTSRASNPAGSFSVVNANEVQIIDQAGSRRKISRRDMARTFLTAAAAGFALPAIAADHSVLRHLSHASLMERADAQLASANWEPLVLTSTQEESLRSLAEVMLPGSTKALVSRFIDLLLSADNEIVQKKFVGSLDAVDQESASHFGKPFSKIGAQDQQSLLSAISAAPRSGDPGSRMRGHFEDLKEWIVPAYYSSEVGMRDLGWTPDRVFASFPACTHEEGHA